MTGVLPLEKVMLDSNAFSQCDDCYFVATRAPVVFHFSSLLRRILANENSTKALNSQEQAARMKHSFLVSIGSQTDFLIHNALVVGSSEKLLYF